MRLPHFDLPGNDDQFRQLLGQLAAPHHAYSATAIASGQGPNRIVGINVGKLLPLLEGENPNRNFVCNLTLAIIEELVHLIDPDLSEEQVNVIVNSLAQKFLGIGIPPEIKEEFARIVAENEVVSKAHSL